MADQNSKVMDYVEATALTYSQLWYSPKDLAIHFGYYDKTVKKHSDALLKINDVISTIVNITEKDYVLDAGCGIGGTGIWLAKHKQCRVVGIDLATYRLQKAILNAVEHQVSEFVDFKKQDYTKTLFADSTFSVVWGHEAICHTNHKDRFINEAFRVLNDNGRLVIAEYLLREDPPFATREKKALDQWLNGWAMHSLLTLNEYKMLIKKAGFKRVEVHDITANTTPSLRRLARMTYPVVFSINLFFKLKLDKWLTPRDRWILKNIQASYFQYRLLKSNGWKYMVIVAHKNEDMRS